MCKFDCNNIVYFITSSKEDDINPQLCKVVDKKFFLSYEDAEKFFNTELKDLKRYFKICKAEIKFLD